VWVKRNYGPPPFGIPEFTGMFEHEAELIWQRCQHASYAHARTWIAIGVQMGCLGVGGWLCFRLGWCFGDDAVARTMALFPVTIGLCVVVLIGRLLRAVIGRPLIRRLVRNELGLSCRKCDYDLTGNVSDVCPECGTPIPLKPEAGK